MKEVANKVDKSIGADPVPLIQQAILAILLPKFPTFCSGLSMSLIFKGLKNNANGRRVDLLLILVYVTEDLGTRGVVSEVFLIVSQILDVVDASTDFLLQTRLLQSKLYIERNIDFPYTTPVVVRVWTHLETLQ